MRVLFIGYGSIAKRHIGILEKNYPEIEIWVYNHTDNSIYCPIENLVFDFNFDDRHYCTFDIAFICSPTNTHIDYAIKCAELGMNLFIEKPIDCKLDRLDELISIVEEKGLTAYVAYPFRFHEGINSFKNSYSIKNVAAIDIRCGTYLKDWAKKYSLKRETGGGAILELSHEIDLVNYFMGGVEGHQVFMSGDVDLYGERLDGYVEVDFLKDNKLCNVILNITVKSSRTIKLKGAQGIQSIEYQANDQMYIDQMIYFFRNIKNPNLMNNLKEAAPLFRQIIHMREEIYETFDNDLRETE